MNFDRPNVYQFKPPQIHPGTIIKILVVLVVVAFAWSTWYTVGTDEAGVILRFGKYVRTTEPGLHFKFPAPIETVYRVPVQRQLKEEFGFRTKEAGVRTEYESSEGYKDESVMLTGDLNVAVVEWIAQYRIRDPYKFLFKVHNVVKTFRDMNEAVMREVVGDRSVNEVLTVGRQEVADQVQQRLQDLCDQYETGIKVEQIVLQDVNPPDPVKPSFNEVNQAQQEKEKTINEARAEYNKVIPRARGRAEQTIEQAQGYATDRVNRAKGDADLFNQYYAAYKKAPNVTRRRIYLETMASIYPKVKNKIVLDSDLKGILPLLPFTGEVKK